MRVANLLGTVVALLTTLATSFGALDALVGRVAFADEFDDYLARFHERVADVRVDDFDGRLPHTLPGTTTSPEEDEFFDLLWRCDSPLASARESAISELTRRFRDFEAVWTTRAFLDNGEISSTSAQRFLEAEASTRVETVCETLDAFDAVWNVATLSDTVDAVDAESSSPTRAASLRLSWTRPLRFVWISPNLQEFRYYDPETDELWRPRARFSSPELLPNFDAESIEIQTYLEPVRRREGVASSDDSSESVEETSRSIASFDALLGVDPRVFPVPVHEGQVKPREFRSGELTISDVVVRRNASGDAWLLSFRMRYDVPHDAFVSYRSWYDANDFALIAPDFDAPLFPRRYRTTETSADGERVELEFPSDSTVEAALQGAASRLLCRLPRYFIREKLTF